jgi:type IV secretory pathway TrbF-like protein
MLMGEPSFFPPEGGNSTAFNKTSNELALHDTIQGISQRNARMWQIIALVSLSAFFISLIILAVAVNLPKTIPVIVTVNPEGESHYIGKVDRSMYGNTSIPEISKEYQINKLITRMHSRVIDLQAQRLYVGETQAIVQAGAIRQLDTFYRSDNPYDHIGEETRSVQMEPLLKQTNNTYICYFRVIRRHINGYELSNDRWTALVNIDVYESTPENPLGIYITNFDLKQIMEEKK